MFLKQRSAVDFSLKSGWLAREVCLNPVRRLVSRSAGFTDLGDELELVTEMMKLR